MRKLILSSILSILFITSCRTNKEILHPYVKFEIYDSVIRTPLSNVNLFRTDYRDSINEHLILDTFSNINGIIIIPKSEIRLIGSANKIMPLTSIKYVFRKNGYVDFVLDLHTYFKISSEKDYRKKYNSKIYLTKMNTLPNNGYK